MAEDRKLEGAVHTPVSGSQATAGFATAARLSASSDVSAIEQRYDSVSEIGRGGMGTVYRARDRETDEVVALKVLNSNIAADPQLIERFKAELRLARKITHKNVCRTHELLRFGNTIAISMEFVPGESLRSVLRRDSGVSLRRAVEWTGQICDALTEAHQQGIVHRDLKPENIHIDEQGQAKVMDFGLAHSGDSNLTVAGVTVGTPAYMSPEQVEGKPADARSDLYALGLILHEMLTGKVTFAADTPAAAALRRLREPPPSPRETDPNIPRHLEHVVLRCLALDPKERFESAAQLKAALAAPTDAPAAFAGQAPSSPFAAFVQRPEQKLGFAAAVFFLCLLISQYAPREQFFWMFPLIANLSAAVLVWPGLGRFGRWFWMATGSWLLDMALMAFVLLRLEKIYLTVITKASFEDSTARMMETVWILAFLYATLPLLVTIPLIAPTKPGNLSGKWWKKWWGELEGSESLLRLADSPRIGAAVLALNLVIGGFIVFQCLVVPLSVLLRLRK